MSLIVLTEWRCELPGVSDRDGSEAYSSAGLAAGDDVCRLLRTVVERDGVLLAYLIGSKSQERDGPRSDLDVALYIERGHDAPVLSREIREGISARTGFKDVDIVLLNEAPPHWRYVSVQTGKLIYSRCDEFRARFETNSRLRYWDREYYENRQDRIFLDRFREGNLGRD